MRPVVLFRLGLTEHDELESCKKYFHTIGRRNEIKEGDLVIPRYSALPWYQELESEINFVGAKMINSWKQHSYVANLEYWYQDLFDITPKTYFNLSELPEDKSFVLKGSTNSKKHLWNTHMFAKDKNDAKKVYLNLLDDSLIGEQKIVIREFVDLNQLDIGINGIPITEEYRFFVLNGEIVSSGFYWFEHTSYLKNKKEFIPNVNRVCPQIISKILSRVSGRIPFYVFDIGILSNGSSILIELNDGQQSGLGDNSADDLYNNMSNIIKNKMP